MAANYTIVPNHDRATVESWLLAKYKPERLRDADLSAMIANYAEDLAEGGWTLISHHDARSGVREVAMLEGHHEQVYLA